MRVRGHGCAVWAILAIAGAPAMAQMPGTPSSTPTPEGGRLVRPQPAQRPARVFDDKLAARTKIDEACVAARQRGTRVLLVFGTHAPMFETTLKESMAAFDVARVVALEFEPVWIFVGTSGEGPANAQIAKGLGVTTSVDSEHATFAVLDADRKLIASAGLVDMLDSMRKRVYSTMKIGDFLAAHKAAAPVALSKLESAQATAKGQGKAVLLSFCSHADPWCGKWRKVLALAQVRAAIESVAVIVDIELDRDQDAFALIEKTGGRNVQSVPWFALVDGDAKVLKASQTEETPNIGFPSTDEEIPVFLSILNAGTKKLTTEQEKAVRESLESERAGGR